MAHFVKQLNHEKLFAKYIKVVASSLSSDLKLAICIYKSFDCHMRSTTL